MNSELRFTDKEITAWGGMGLMKRLPCHIQFRPALLQSGLPQPGSHRGYAPEQLVTQSMRSVWCGTPRFRYQAQSWSAPRGVTQIRQHINQRPAPKGKTLSLFADNPVVGRYRSSALVSDMDLPAQAIWHPCRGWANCENRVKEPKYDFAADSVNRNDFRATEAARNVDKGATGCGHSFQLARKIRPQSTPHSPHAYG